MALVNEIKENKAQTNSQTQESKTQANASIWSIPASVALLPFMVIAVSGGLGSGKNYMLDKCLSKWFLAQQLWIVSLAMAYQLKVDAQFSLGLTFDECYVTKPSHARKKLQVYGSTKRDEVSLTYWIDQVHYQILAHVFNGARVVFLTDTRYLNEMDYVRQTFGMRGLLIRIHAPKRTQAKIQEDYRVMKKDAEGKDVVDPVTGKAVLDVDATQKLQREIAEHPSETQALLYKDWDLVLQNDPEYQDSSQQDLIKYVQKTKAYQAIVAQ